MANTSVMLTELDFDSLKQNFKTFLRGQDIYQDYDFDASNIGVLLDLLSYNTYINSFYLNMIGTEMWSDSAILRDSVVSHAKDTNYVPRSFNASYANVDISIIPENVDETITKIIIPKGSSFSARDSDTTLTFTTDSNYIASKNGNTYVASGIKLYEGNYISESFIVDKDNNSKYILQNRKIDIRDITVSVIEDNGASVYPYSRAYTLFGLSSDSQVFFVQGSSDDKYEIVFGDGVIGRIPKNNSVVLVEYRICNGTSGNGITAFKTNGAIGGYSNVKVSTNSSATGGADSESIESIKFNAPRHFATQERAVIPEDYETLLKINYPEINAISAYGGEEAVPPQYGKIFIAVDLNNVDGLPSSKRIEYTNFMKSRSTISMDPIFIQTDYLYLYVKSNIKYNINLTTLNTSDIESFATVAVSNYNATFLNNFKKTMRYSKLVNIIDTSHNSIVSNQTDVFGLKKIKPILNSLKEYTIDFGFPLYTEIPPYSGTHNIKDDHIIESSIFSCDNQLCVLTDDSLGNMWVCTLSGDNHIMNRKVGTVDYNTGFVQISNVPISAYEGDSLKFYARPNDKDITASKNAIIKIIDEDIDITVEQIRE